MIIHLPIYFETGARVARPKVEKSESTLCQRDSDANDWYHSNQEVSSSQKGYQVNRFNFNKNGVIIHLASPQFDHLQRYVLIRGYGWIIFVKIVPNMTVGHPCESKMVLYLKYLNYIQLFCSLTIAWLRDMGFVTKYLSDQVDLKTSIYDKPSDTHPLKFQYFYFATTLWLVGMLLAAAVLIYEKIH